MQQELQRNFRTTWNQIDTVFVDLEETLVTKELCPNYDQLLRLYKDLNVQTYASYTGKSLEEAQSAVDGYRRRYSGRGEMIYKEEFGTFDPWFDALSTIEPADFIGQTPQIQEFLNWIKAQGKRVILASNTPAPLVKKILDTTGIDPITFEEVIAWENPTQPYPKDDNGTSWELTFGKYNGRRCAIGDSKFDYEPAVQQGNIGIGVGPIPRGNYSFWLPSIYTIRQLVEGENI